MEVFVHANEFGDEEDHVAFDDEWRAESGTAESGAPSTVAELRGEVTEMILENVPELTGSQLIKLREAFLLLARRHDWA